MLRKIFLFFLFFSITYFITAQDLSSSQQQKIEEYNNLIKKYEQEGKTSAVVNYLTKAGNIYWQANDLDNAIANFSKALNLLENSKNTSAKVTLNNYLGFLYMSKEDYNQALTYFNNAYDLIQYSNDKTSVASVLTNIGQCKRKSGDLNGAISAFDEALSIALELDNLQMVKNIAAKLAQTYQALGDNQNYIKYYNLSVNFDKKIKEEQLKEKEKEVLMQKQIAQQKSLMLQVQEYQNKIIADSLQLQQQINAQNQYQIQLLNQQKELQEIKLKQQQEQLAHEQALSKARKKANAFLLTGLLLLSIAFLLILRLFFINKNQKERLQNLYDELQKKNEEIEKNRKELERKNKQITDSIRYASRIQNAILPVKKAIEKSFKEVFVFYQPRDVVSGDFYWFAETEKSKIIAAIDCTGHSVPGAFMSMIANTLLNEIVKAKGVCELKEILALLNKGVFDTLHNADKKDVVNDGLDISIFKFSKSERKAKFAAANHVSVIFVDGKMQLLEGDFYSIDGLVGSNEHNFSEHEVELGTQAEIYLFSDGFIDQFNEKGRKYMSKNFFALLEKIHSLPMHEQEDVLTTEFLKWKGNYRQIDDVLVIGLRI